VRNSHFQLVTELAILIYQVILGASGISLVHDLTVKELVKEVNRPPEVVPIPGGSNSEPLSDDGSTADEYEDASDVVMEDMFLRELTPSRPQPLSKDKSLKNKKSKILLKFT
jgi:hypothetical protein